MILHQSLLQSTILLIHWDLTFSWNLPPVDFITSFAQKHDRSKLVVCLPEGMKEMDVNNHFALTMRQLPSSYIFLPFLTHTFLPFIMKHNNESIKIQNEQDFILFIPDEKDLNQSSNTFKTWFNKRLRTNREYWLIDISNWNLIQNFKNDMKDLQLDLDDDLFLYKNESGIIHLYEAYNINQNFETKIKEYGNWFSSEGLVLTQQDKWRRRSQLEGVQLKLETLVSNPYITDLIQIGPKEYAMKGMFADVFFALQDILNFTYVLKKPPDELWGSLQSDGTWTGMVRGLQDGRTDIAVTDFTVTRARSDVITFAEPIVAIYHTLFIQNPSGTFNFMAYLEPMQYMSWVLIGLFVLFSPIILALITRFGYDFNKNEFTWEKSQMIALGAVTMRGWYDTPVQLSSRCAFIVILLAGIVIYYLWEAMLVSYLSTRVIVLPFNNIRELVENTDFRIAIIPGTSFEDAFKYSTDPIWQKAYKERIKPYLDEYMESYLQMVDLPLKDSSLALYDNFYSSSAFPQYEKCQLIAIPAKYDYKPYAYGFQKDSPYLGLFNYYLKELREKGAMKQILNKYESGAQVCPDESGKPLGFESCFTAFLALLLGIIIAIVVSIFEHLPATWKPLVVDKNGG